MHRHYLLSLLDHYRTPDPDEHAMQQRMRDFVEQHQDCFKRELMIGHITGSAWLINRERNKVLLLHHRKLDRWLQPGGHSDGDPNTLGVALREAREETGLQGIEPVSDAIFDIDIHTIPARRNEPEHEHFDVRFLLQADDSETLVISGESNQLAWVAIDEVSARANERSILRMLEKTR